MSKLDVLLKALLEGCENQFIAARTEAGNIAIGRKVKIISKTYNGQVYGRSKPKLFGKIATVTHVSLNWSHVSLVLEEYQAGIALKDVEFVEE